MDWGDSFEVPDERSQSMPLCMPPRTLPPFHAFSHKQSACDLLVRALGTDGRVDFPIVTEICEGVAADSEELCAVVEVLSAALQEDARHLEQSSLRLKALTVIHELLYDAEACRAFIEMPSFVSAIQRLHRQHRREVALPNKDAASLAEGPAAECARLLTSEICRSLEVASICQL
jgi:hypothetical protein